MSLGLSALAHRVGEGVAQQKLRALRQLSVGNQNCRRHAIIHRMPRCLNTYCRARALVDLLIRGFKGWCG